MKKFGKSSNFFIIAIIAGLNIISANSASANVWNCKTGFGSTGAWAQCTDGAPSNVQYRVNAWCAGILNGYSYKKSGNWTGLGNQKLSTVGKCGWMEHYYGQPWVESNSPETTGSVKPNTPNNTNSKFDAVKLENSLKADYPWNSSNCSLNKNGQSYYPKAGESSSGLDGHGYGCRQCTSFAAWRVNKITQKKYLENLKNPIDWYKNAGKKGFKSKNGLNVVENPAKGVIAVWEKHVAVVENVSGINVIVSEGNYKKGQIKVESKKDIDKRGDAGKFKGYLSQK